MKMIQSAKKPRPMGPQLLLDKSSLQSLSYDETWCMNRHYYLVYAPVLFIEVLGDLKLHPDDLDRSKRLVATIAGKIQAADSAFSPHYRTLLAANLMGNFIENKGRPVLVDGHDIVDSPGRRGIFFDEEPEREALRRWTEGNFSDAEHLLSERWRQSTRAINLEQWRNILRGTPHAASLDEAKLQALAICRDPGNQLQNLRFLLSQAFIPDAQAIHIYDFWLRRGMPSIEAYAPYAFYCLTVYTTFFLGLASQLIGSRATNRVDMEYVLYLPFCRAFVSNDRFHKDFAPLFLTKDQDFISGVIFKGDIKRINAHWQGLNAEERMHYHDKNGSYPPDWADSVTHRIWKKHMRPRSEYKPMKLTPELEKRIMDHLGPMMDEINKISPTKD